MITMMNTRIGMTTMTRLLCTWDVEGMSAELYTLMQIAAALLRIDNDRGDEEQKTVTYILMKLRNMRLIFILSYHFSPIRETPKSVGFLLAKKLSVERGGYHWKNLERNFQRSENIFSVYQSQLIGARTCFTIRIIFLQNRLPTKQEVSDCFS